MIIYKFEYIYEWLYLLTLEQTQVFDNFPRLTSLVCFLSSVRILTALTEELYKIVEERENKVIPLSKEEQDEYETKLRNFRVQLRKAEETATELQKQKTELDAKLKKNDEEVMILIF